MPNIRLTLKRDYKLYEQQGWTVFLGMHLEGTLTWFRDETYVENGYSHEPGFHWSLWDEPKSAGPFKTLKEAKKDMERFLTNKVKANA